MKLPKPIEIFKVGTHKCSKGTSLSFTDEEVSAWAGGGLQIPLVPGHPKDDEPVMGYATAIEFGDDGVLRLTEVEGLNPTFKQVVNSGQLDRVSIKLAKAGGDWVMRHIGFLGTSPPALKDLAAASFAAEEVLIFGAADGPEDEDDPDDPDDGIDLDDAEEEPMPTDTSFEAQFSAHLQELADREAAFAEREAAIAQKEAEFAARTIYAPMVDDLVRSGRVLPVDRSALVALFCSLVDREVEFAAGPKGEDVDTGNGAELLARILQGGPKKIDYSEFSGSDKAAPTQNAEFAAKMTGGVGEFDDDRMAEYQRTMEYSKKHGCSFVEAMRRISE